MFIKCIVCLFALSFLSVILNTAVCGSIDGVEFIGGVNPCSQPHDEGECEGDQTRFAFDSNAESCVPFSYTGCGGNKNNYATLEACAQSCMGKPISDRK